MTADIRRGVHYEVGSERARFFDIEGAVLDGQRCYKGLPTDDDGFLGAVISAFAKSMFIPVDDDDPMPSIRRCIAGDVANGKGNAIAQLWLRPSRAVTLCLIGVLTPKHFVEGKVVEGIDFVDIHDVQIDGRVLTVRVLRNPEYGVATADANGQMIE